MVRASSRISGGSAASPADQPEIFFRLPVIGFGLSLLALVSALLQLLQTRMMMPSSSDPQAQAQQRAFLLLPLLSLVYGSFLPAGLFIYWIVTTIFSIVQQYLIAGWGSLFPLFGWTPSFAVGHTPRFAPPPPKLPALGTGKPTAAPTRRDPTRQRGGHGEAKQRTGPDEPAREASMSSEYQEFTGKTVEEALRQARQTFGVSGLDDLDFEILTPGSRGVLGMGAEPARVIAAPRAALGVRRPGGRPPRQRLFRHRLRGHRARLGRPAESAASAGWTGARCAGSVSGRAEPGHEDAPATAPAPPVAGASLELGAPRIGRSPATTVRDRIGDERRERGGDRGRDRRGGREQRGPVTLTDGERAEVAAARSLNVEREEVQAAEASPEALEAGRDILQTMLGYLGYNVVVTVQTGETAKLDVTGEGAEKEALGALIGRKGERLSALQHLVNLLLSRRMGEWTRVLVDVEDYRGRRERQLREIANRAADRVEETGKMLQLEPMPALERRWIHLALRDRTGVATQSIGEEPNRRVVVIRREA